MGYFDNKNIYNNECEQHVCLVMVQTAYHNVTRSLHSILVIKDLKRGRDGQGDGTINKKISIQMESSLAKF